MTVDMDHKHRDSDDLAENITLTAWEQYWESFVSTGETEDYDDDPRSRGPCGACHTEIYLPVASEISVKEAWYGHPSDAARRVNLTEQIQRLVKKNLSAGSPINAQLCNDNVLCLRACSTLWGEDPCRFVWKMLFVKFSIDGSDQTNLMV